MKKSRDDIKNALATASEILLACNQKAIVLKVCNDFAEQEGGFPETDGEDINAVYAGISVILTEIIEQISEAQSLIGGVEGSVNSLSKSAAKEVAVS